MPSWRRELRPGGPWGTVKTKWTPTAAYNMEEWMWGLEEDASKVEVRNGKVSNHGTERRNAYSQCACRRWQRRQGTLQLLRDTSGGSPSSGGGSSNWGSKWSSHQSTMMRGSRESNWVGGAGSLRVKISLPIFKDEKAKDAVPYHSWQWDIAIFCHSGWDNQHLLLYVFQSLQGFPGDFARSLGHDAILTNILQTLDEHYGMVMTFDALNKELYSVKQGSGENLAKFGMYLSQQAQILKLEYPGRIQQEHVEEIKWDHFWGPEPQILAHVGPQSGWQTHC